MSTPAPAPAPAPTPAPAPAPSQSPAPAPAPAEARTVPYDRFHAKVEAYNTAAAELEAARQQLAEARGQIEALQTQVVRADVRVATGVDDDGMADLLHGRYQREIQGQEQPPALADWWTALQSDEARRAALPRGLQVYAQPPAAPAPAPAPRAGTRVPGTTAPRPGRSGMTADDFGKLDGAGRRDAMRSFFGRRTV